MVQNIKSFCDKIDSIKKMADNLRETSPSDPLIRNKIEGIRFFLLKDGADEPSNFRIWIGRSMQWTFDQNFKVL